MAYWIDDGFDSWPQVVRAGTAAVGLYVRCGSWIARNTHDGLVPSEVAAMYGTPEWARRLVEVGLWRTEGSGYRDQHYHEMGNPTAEKVRERRKADAERKARWRAKRDQSRRDKPRDSNVSPRGSPGVSPFFPALPPSKEGAVGERPRGARSAAARHEPEDPRAIAEEQQRLASLAIAREQANAEADARARAGVALARAAVQRTKPATPGPAA